MPPRYPAGGSTGNQISPHAGLPVPDLQGAPGTNFVVARHGFVMTEPGEFLFEMALPNGQHGIHRIAVAIARSQSTPEAAQPPPGCFFMRPSGRVSWGMAEAHDRRRRFQLTTRGILVAAFCMALFCGGLILANRLSTHELVGHDSEVWAGFCIYGLLFISLPAAIGGLFGRAIWAVAVGGALYLMYLLAVVCLINAYGI
jgi:hypothetical protein